MSQIEEALSPNGSPAAFAALCLLDALGESGIGMSSDGATLRVYPASVGERLQGVIAECEQELIDLLWRKPTAKPCVECAHYRNGAKWCDVGGKSTRRPDITGCMFWRLG